MQLRMRGERLLNFFATGSEANGGSWAWRQDELRGGVTHTLLCGGCLSVRPEEEARFLEAVGEAYAEGRTNYIVERKTVPVFALFLDVDLLFEEPFILYTDEQLGELCGVIHEEVRGCFAEGAAGRLVVTAGEPMKAKKSSRSKSELVKCGYHLRWPGALVDCAGGLAIRERVVERLKRDFPRPEYNPWSDAVDEAPLTTTHGLRMPGSSKSCRCDGPGCNRRGCVLCGQTGVLELKKPYRPLLVLDAAGGADANELDRLQTDLQYQVSALTIRRPTHSVDSLLPLSAAVIEARRKYAQHQVVMGNGNGYIDVGIGDGGAHVQTNMLNAANGEMQAFGGMSLRAQIPSSDKRFVEAVKFVKKKFGTFYRDTRFSSMLRICHREHGYWMYYLRADASSPGGMYCQNVGRNHTSCNISFVFYEDCCMQRCFSKKRDAPPSDILGVQEPGKRRTVCKKEEGAGMCCCCCYWSERVPLPPSLRQTMFADKPTESVRAEGSMCALEDIGNREIATSLSSGYTEGGSSKSAMSGLGKRKMTSMEAKGIGKPRHKAMDDEAHKQLLLMHKTKMNQMQNPNGAKRPRP